jgi:hypothetical protein
MKTLVLFSRPFVYVYAGAHGKEKTKNIDEEGAKQQRTTKTTEFWKIQEAFSAVELWYFGKYSSGNYEV